MPMMGVVVIVDVAIQIPAEFVEPEMHWVAGRFHPQVPFAKQGCLVSMHFKHLGDGLLIGIEGGRIQMASDHINDADTLLVPASEERSAGRATDRAVRMKVSEGEAFVGHAL